MKEIVILLLGTIFILLLADSTESVAADHLEPGEGIFKNENQINLVSIKDSKYQVYLQVEVRNAQGQLISITETTHVKYIPHEITDDVFDTMLGKKEIITINNIKYEKIQFSDTYRYTDTTMTYHNQNLFDLSDREPTGRWVVEICGESLNKFGFECAKIFQSRTSIVWLELDDVTTSNWTILKKIN